MFSSFLLLAAAVAVQAQPQSDGQTAVVARVDDQAITAAELQYEVQRALGDRQLDAASLSALRKATLEQLIQRRLAQHHFNRKGFGASQQEIDLVIQRKRRELEDRESSLDEYLARAGLSDASFRAEVAWQIGWPRFLKRFLTEDNLQNYFEQHRREFDGTQLKVAHILFPVEAGADDQGWEKARASAQRVRGDIESGLDFADAASRHSGAPTARAGGDIGYIQRHRPMPEPFSQAAFALQEGEVSPPVASPYGVHLILCKHIKPGEKTMEDVRSELRTAAIRFLFQWAADQQRGDSVVEVLLRD